MHASTTQILSKSNPYMNNSNRRSDNEAMITKTKLSNGMEVFDFDEDAIIAKMESLMDQLDAIL
jgi:hypothetical protein